VGGTIQKETERERGSTSTHRAYMRERTWHVCAAWISAPVHTVLPHPSLYVCVWRRHKHGKLVYKKLRQENIQVLINALASSARTNVNLPRSETQVRLCALRETEREREALRRGPCVQVQSGTVRAHTERMEMHLALSCTHTQSKRGMHMQALSESSQPPPHTHIYIHIYATHTVLACVIYTSCGRLY
jgi:hypothetical protein